MTDTNTQPAIPPVVGKRHRMRNGEETGVVVESALHRNLFTDGNHSWALRAGGLAYHAGRDYDIVAVIEDEAPDYMDGNWHPWAGGECPVPGDVRVETKLYTGTHYITGCVRDVHWPSVGSFRVILDAQAPNSPAGGEVWGSAPTVRQEVLKAAADAVLRDRNKTYDAPEQSFGLIAAYWSAHLDAKILPHDVAVMMSLLKLARIKTSPEHQDSWVDLAGYAACGAEVAQANNGEDVE